MMHLDGVGFPEAVAVLAGGKYPSPVPQRTAIARPALDCERKRQRALSDDADVTAGLVIGERLETTLAGMVFGFNTTDKASLSVRPEWLAQQSCYREVDFCSRTATSL